MASLRSPGLPSTDYYAPDYRIVVEKLELDPRSKGDVLDVKVTMDLEQLSGLELTVNNWDDSKFAFKYTDTSTFDLGNEIRLSIGYSGKLLTVFEGLITSMTPRFPESGPPTVAISAQSRMLLMKNRKPKDGEKKQFLNTDDGDIVREVARRNNLVPKVSDSGVTHDIVIQKNQDDATFVMERAKRLDFDCFIGIDPDTGQPGLYFQKPTDDRDGSSIRVYVFEWGKSLISFNPTISLNRQVGRVTVKGWDPRTKSTIKYTASSDDLPVSTGGDNGPTIAQTKLQDREDIVVDQPVTSLQEAKALAQAQLRERAYSYLTAQVQVIGLPDLRPGDNVEIQGVGKRFSGQYYVTKVEHALGSNGFLTTLQVRSWSDGGTTS